jgi:uncharacterized protein YdeI (YjbR/CyaY-like superfamily)
MFRQSSKITNIDQNTWVTTSIFNNVLFLIVTNCSHNEKYNLITNIYVRPNITLTFLANNKDNSHCTFHSQAQLMDEQSFESLMQQQNNEQRAIYDDIINCKQKISRERLQLFLMGIAKS